MRALKWAAGLLGGVVLVAAGGIVAATYAVDTGALTPRILAAIEAATGRTATLGRVSVGLGLTPRVTIEDATLANIPGGSRPEFAGKTIVIIIPSFAERYLSTALFEGLD